MKKICIGNLLPLIMLLFWGCQKSSSNFDQPNDPNTPNELSVAEAKTFFVNYIQNSSVSNNSEANKVFTHPTPDWSKAFTTADQESYAVEVPIRFDKSVGFNTHLAGSSVKNPINTKTSLVILKHKETGTLRAVLMFLTAPQDVNLQSVNYGNKNEFSGTVLFTTMESELINGWVYEKGKIKSTISKKEDNTTSRMELPEDCTTIQIDWYEQTCTTYPNNTEICSGWAYTHSTYQTVCTGDGSSGGGGAGGGSGCSYTNATARSLIDAATFSFTTNGSVFSGPESGPDANGQIEKDLLLTRHVVKWNIIYGHSVEYTLIFKGRVFKTAANQPWKWKTFTFDKLQKTSGNVPPCFAENTTASVVTSISSDKKDASFTALVSGTLTITCLFGKEASTKTLTLNDTYNADLEAR